MDSHGFTKEVQFHTMIQGSVNGMAFSVEGKGRGSAATGKQKGKWVCTSGKLPMSWAALSDTLTMQNFAKYPNGLVSFFQESMPEGITQERVTRFQDDGTLKMYREIKLERGVLFNKVTLQGEGFKAGSPVLRGDIKAKLSSTTRILPYEDGIKSLGYLVFPGKQDSSSYIIATQTTVNRPLGEGRKIPVPAPHFIRSEIKQFRDIDDDSDHIVQDIAMEAYRLSLLN